MGSKQNSFYFDNFIACADYSRKAAQLLDKGMRQFDPAQIGDMIEEMHEVEHAGDEKKHELLNVLAKAFITPIEREDIILLGQNIDEVTDKIEDVLLRMYCNNIKSVRPDALELVAVVSTRGRLRVPEEIMPGDLPRLPLVLREKGSGTLDVIGRALEEHGIKLSDLHVLMHLGSTESIKLFLEHADCMGIVSVRSISRELAEGRLRVVEVESMPMHRDFCFVRLQGQEGGLAQTFELFAVS